MSMQVSLCFLKIEIDQNSMSENRQGGGGDNDEAVCGAVSVDHPNNPRIIREHRGNRKPQQITVQNYTNKMNINKEKQEEGILPKSSRESTPQAEGAVQVAAGGGGGVTTSVLDDITFFSGNPFVEVTKGIIHLYKQK